MGDTSFDQAYEQWRSALCSLTGGAAELSEWQDRRFRFAHSVGALLTSAAGYEAPPVSGPVVYGVYLHGAGLAYVGQTQEAERRLRDLPIGESHHLANTVPPELWERVVVVQWTKLLVQLDAPERAAVESMGLGVCGLALEHLLQRSMRPPLNARRRTRDGDWRLRRAEESRSRGAVHSTAIPQLQGLVRATWMNLSRTPDPADGSGRMCSTEGRVVFPSVVNIEDAARPSTGVERCPDIHH